MFERLGNRRFEQESETIPEMQKMYLECISTLIEQMDRLSTYEQRRSHVSSYFNHIYSLLSYNSPDIEKFFVVNFPQHSTDVYSDLNMKHIAQFWNTPEFHTYCSLSSGDPKSKKVLLRLLSCIGYEDEANIIQTDTTKVYSIPPYALRFPNTLIRYHIPKPGSQLIENAFGTYSKENRVFVNLNGRKIDIGAKRKGLGVLLLEPILQNQRMDCRVGCASCYKAQDTRETQRNSYQAHSITEYLEAVKIYLLSSNTKVELLWSGYEPFQIMMQNKREFEEFFVWLAEDTHAREKVFSMDICTASPCFTMPNMLKWWALQMNTLTVVGIQVGLTNHIISHEQLGIYEMGILDTVREDRLYPKFQLVCAEGINFDIPEIRLDLFSSCTTEAEDFQRLLEIYSPSIKQIIEEVLSISKKAQLVGGVVYKVILQSVSGVNAIIPFSLAYLLLQSHVFRSKHSINIPFEVWCGEVAELQGIPPQNTFLTTVGIEQWSQAIDRDGDTFTYPLRTPEGKITYYTEKTDSIIVSIFKKFIAHPNRIELLQNSLYRGGKV